MHARPPLSPEERHEAWSRLHSLTTGVAVAGIAATVAIGAVATTANPGKASGLASANQGDDAGIDGRSGALPTRRHRPTSVVEGRPRRRRRRRRNRGRARPAAGPSRRRPVARATPTPRAGVPDPEGPVPVPDLHA